MPQLNLAWWIFNFLIGWIALIIMFTTLLNISIPQNDINPPSFTSSISNNNWTWN
uniref:ATP synthase complex subunit 8 n=1 Tax=Anthenea aspera TaxID=2769427 RepID=A0A7S8CUL0_9ECHI|nr:ATP synthase F0 subunit 8 [Anthenea aspera]QPC56438.1 ATP synthase F0 subunit 8 [Anthenea aspera]